jgi:nucleotidyltransferase/DNA polymerase involved in DNA repair
LQQAACQDRLRHAESDGLTIIGEGDITAHIWPLPVRKIPGVGPVTEERLRGIGVATIGQLTAMQLDTLLWLFSWRISVPNLARH